MRTPQRYAEVDRKENTSTANYYGLTKLGWYGLTPEERVIHYNRQNVCEHKADIRAWPELLREQYSLDPYANTPHLSPHKRQDKTCACQTCIGQFGKLDIRTGLY